VNHLGPSLLLPRRAHGGSGASIDAATAGRDTCDPVGGVLPPRVPHPPLVLPSAFHHAAHARRFCGCAPQRPRCPDGVPVGGGGPPWALCA